jgi:hypothetical protein
MWRCLLESTFILEEPDDQYTSQSRGCIPIGKVLGTSRRELVEVGAICWPSQRFYEA